MTIRQAIAAATARGEKAAGLFLTNGFPDPISTLPILFAMDDAGADFIELGMPFSDPLAEGLPIQRSSERALSHGVTMPDAFETARAFKAQRSTPVLLMGYINPIYRYGVSNFCRDAASSGVDGLILADLPPEEGHLIEAEARDAGLDLVYLIAPNTADARIAAIDEQATAFIYAVSVTGLTGSDLGGLDRVQAYLRRAKGIVQDNPLLVGFGIRSHDDAMRLSAETDGFIVGSALIQTVERLWGDASLSETERLDGVRAFVRGLKYGEEPAIAS
ncbi:MAG: tryptophan synthase subunit alpha [Rhodothermales bacterium]